jgi:hypothetical protein
MINTERIESLLARNGEDFVIGAYRALLGRDPDKVGFNNYLEQVRLGVDKLELLESFLISAEGKRLALAWAPALKQYREQYRQTIPTPLLKKMKRMPAVVQRWIAPSLSATKPQTVAVTSLPAEPTDPALGRLERTEATIAALGLNHWEPPVSAMTQAEQLSKLTLPAQEIYLQLLAEIAAVERTGTSNENRH